MAVQAQLYSDHYQNNNSNITLGLPHQDYYWPFTSSGFEHQQDSRFLDPQKIMNFDPDYQNNLVSSSSSSSRRYNGFQGFSSELERQRLEMDCFLHFQNEKLKAVLTEETRKREMMMMHNYESKMKAIIDAKDEVLNTAKTRTNELQNYLSMAETEADNWEKKAMETEVMMTELHTKLKQARARRHEDAESVCNGGDNNNNNNNNGGVDEKERQKKMVCKVCHVRSSCVLLLPCRHLCCCRPCEGLLMFCPVCETVKNGSLEVFFGLN